MVLKSLYKLPCNLNLSCVLIHNIALILHHHVSAVKITGGVIRMKFRMYGMILSLFFALGLVFSFGTEASAHDGNHSDGQGVTAENVDPTNKAHVEALLTHIIDYYNQAYGAHPGVDLAAQAARTREVIIYGRQIRIDSEDGGLYKDGDVYSMAVNEIGTVTNHGGHPNLFGQQFDSGATDSAVASTIQTLIDGSGINTQPVCEQYGDQGRWACATKVQSDLGPVTVIVGLHHAVDDSALSPPDCTEFTLATNAEKVFASQSDADLVAYVQGVIRVAQEQRAAAVNAQFMEFLAGGGNLLELADQTSDAAREFGVGVFQRIYSKVACFGAGDLKHENIYPFIMAADPSVSTVLFNGNNFDLNGATLELVDDQLSGEQNIAKLFNNELGDPVNGASTYVNYHWDDPTTDEDNVPNFFENRKVPGTSCKRSYIEVADIDALLPDTPVEVPEALYIFGSGTYPGDDVCASGDGGDDGDDGCAIAGAEHTHESALLNLFLIASVLFPVVFLRRRI